MNARVVLGVALVFVTSSCTGISSEPVSPRSTSVSTGTPSSATSSRTAPVGATTDGSATTATASPTATESQGQTTDERLTAESLRTGFTQFAKTLKGSVVLAWAPVGSPDAVQSLGGVVDQDAWSTMKVPIAVANVIKDGGTPKASTSATMRRMITVSDNGAALTLWRRLGSRATAQSKVQDVIRRGGDSSTLVRQTSFGLTTWTVANQAAFGAGLPCIKESGPVLALMDQIVRDHRWGFGAVAGDIRFKGGWGPSKHGYLMRQLGIVTLKNGSKVAVAIATQPKGGHSTGAANLSKLADWFVDRLTVADAGTCAQSR